MKTAIMALSLVLAATVAQAEGAATTAAPAAPATTTAPAATTAAAAPAPTEAKAKKGHKHSKKGAAAPSEKM